MFDRRLLGLWASARGLITVNVVLGLAVTASYAAAGLAIAEILGQVFGRPDWPRILLLAGVVVALQALRAGLLWGREVSGTAAAGAVKQAVRARLYRRLLGLGPGYLSTARTGSVKTTLVDGVEFLDKYYGVFLPQLVVSLLGAAALAIYITIIDPGVGAVVIICAILVPVVPRVSSRWVQGPLDRWLTHYYRMSAESLDAIQGMTTLKAFNAHERRVAELRTQWQDNAKASVGLVASVGVYEALVGVAVTVGTALSVGIGALRLTEGHLGMTELFIILLLSRECFRPLADLQRAFHSAYQAPAAAEGIFALLDAPPVISGTAPSANPTGPVASLCFDNVTLRYRPEAAPALDGLSFAVQPGETVAVVGRSGAGKTTLVSLLLRFFDPDRGTVSIGGTDVRHIPVEELRRHVAVVSQDTYLFHGSVADNLRLARPDATHAELEAAATAAHAHGFITALPQGYDTLIGERGLTLSGGERQRLAIARALLKDAPILVLDEATASVDAASEAAIQAALDVLTAQRTTLVIAHRLSTVRGADRIVVLDHGRAAETGPPAELSDRAGGAYARLVASQGATR